MMRRVLAGAGIRVTRGSGTNSHLIRCSLLLSFSPPKHKYTLEQSIALPAQMKKG